jgi:hypothetical protein
MRRCRGPRALGSSLTHGCARILTAILTTQSRAIYYVDSFFVHIGQYTVEGMLCRNRAHHQKQWNRPRPLAQVEKRIFRLQNPKPTHCQHKECVSTPSIYGCANHAVARKISRILSSFVKTRYAEWLAGKSIAPADGRSVQRVTSLRGIKESVHSRSRLFLHWPNSNTASILSVQTTCVRMLHAIKSARLLGHGNRGCTHLFRAGFVIHAIDMSRRERYIGILGRMARLFLMVLWW